MKPGHYVRIEENRGNNIARLVRCIRQIDDKRQVWFVDYDDGRGARKRIISPENQVNYYLDKITL